MGSITLAAASAVETAQRSFGPDGGARHPIMRVIMIIVVLAIIGGFIWALVSLSRAKKQVARAAATPPAPAAPPAPLAPAAPAAAPLSSSAAAIAILDERLAKGDIEPDDYEARKRLLS